VIEISTLNKIHSVQPTFADLDAGVLWLDLLNQIVPQGLTPPALTGFTGLTIAGVLAVGGISSSYQTGAIIDYVRELEVVTGDGEVQRCSPSQNRALFDAVLGGLGQFGIVTRAVIDLVPAPRLVRVYSALYPDSATFFRDLRTVLGRGELEEAYNIGVPNGSGGFAYGFTMAKYFDPSNPPDNDHLLRGLSVAPSAFQAQDVPYLLYLLRVDAAVNQFKALGLWEGVLHPWFDVFLPEGTVEPYVSRVTASLQSDDVGSTGFLLLFPKKRSMLKRPFFRVPDGGEFVYLFDILTANDAPGPDPAFQSRMLARNRRLFEEARLAGGTRYSIGSIQFNHLDWILQYGLTWPAFAELKRVYDPSNILTPGPGIF
jgi:FAD/FMN-containing dehydrogenase